MTPRERAENLDRQGKCIACESPAKSRTRGLCRMHHVRLLRKLAVILRERGPEERDAFERYCVENGLVLANRKASDQSKKPDVFEAAFHAFEASKQATPHDVDRIVAEGADVDELLSASAPPVKREPSLAKRKKSAKKSRQ